MTMRPIDRIYRKRLLPLSPLLSVICRKRIRCFLYTWRESNGKMQFSAVEEGLGEWLRPPWNSAVSIHLPRLHIRLRNYKILEMKNETRRSQLMWRAIRRPYIFSYCVILSCVWYALSIKLSLSPAAQNDGRRIILLASILLWDVLYFFSMIYFLTISKCLLSASKRRWKYTQIGEEKAFTSLTATADFRSTVYARHEGKMYLKRESIRFIRRKIFILYIMGDRIYT